MSLRFLFLLFVASSVIGSTLVGWLAVAKIRRSTGRLYGLRLALFAGLAFPLLALDGVIAWFLHFVTGLVSNRIIAGGGPLPWIAQTYVDLRIAFLWVAIVVISLVVDGLIFWAVWRRLRPETRPATSRSTGTPRPRRKLALIGAALLLCLPLAILTTASLSWWTASRSPQYVSTATLDVRPTSHLPAPLQADFIAKELQLLRTTRILYPVIERLELTKEFSRPGQPKVPAQQAYTRLNHMLDVEEDRDTGLIRLHVRSDDPSLAANIANTIAVVYKENRNQDEVVVKIWGQAEPLPSPMQSKASWIVIPLILLPGGLLAVVGLVLLVIGLAKKSPPLPVGPQRENSPEPKVASAASVSSKPREDRPSLRPAITLLLCLPLSFAAAFGYVLLTPEKPRAMIELEVKSGSPEEAQGFEKRTTAQFGETAEWRIGERSFGRANENAPLLLKAVGELSVSGKTTEEAMEKANTWARSVEEAGRVRIVQSAQPVPLQVSYPRLIRLFGSSLIGGGIVAAMGFVLLTRRLARVKNAAPVPTSAPGQARLAIWMLLLSLLGTPLLLTLAPLSLFPLFFGGLALLLALIFGALGSSQRSARAIVFTVLALVIAGSVGMGILLLHNEQRMKTLRAQARTRMETTIGEQFARAEKEEEVRQKARAAASPPAPSPDKGAMEARLLDLELRLAEARTRYTPEHPARIALEAELRVLEKQYPDLRNTAFYALATIKCDQLQSDLVRLERSYDKEHPQIKAVQTQIAAVQELLAKIKPPARTSAAGAETSGLGPPASEPAGPRIASIGDARFELVAIGSDPHDSQPKKWWTPDGVPYPADSFVTRPWDSSQGGAKQYPYARQFIVRHTNVSENVSRPHWLVDETGLGNVYLYGGGDVSVLANGQPDPALHVFGVFTDAIPPRINLKTFLSAGEWKTVTKCETGPGVNGGSFSSGKTTVSFLKPVDSEGQATVTIVHNSQNEVQIVAVDKSGKEHQHGKQTSNGSGDPFQSITTSFPLPLSEVARFLFQERTRQLIEFRNVALSPKDGNQPIDPPPSPKFNAAIPPETAETKKRREAQERLLELELQAIELRRIYLPANPRMRDIDGKLADLEKQQPGLHDETFWKRVEEKRDLLAVERDRLKAIYPDPNSRVGELQAMVDSLGELLAQRPKDLAVVPPADVQRPNPADVASEPLAQDRQRREAQERLLELELRALDARRVYPPASPRMKSIEGELVELEKQQPGLHDASFWKLVDRKRNLLVVEKDRLEAIFPDPNSRVGELQAMIDSLGELLAQQPVDLTTLPPLDYQKFTSAPYLRAAAYLQTIGQKAACEKMRQLAGGNRDGRQVIALCRMLFTKKGDAEFRRPVLGRPGLLGGTTKEDWPLEPIAEVKGVPFLVVRGYRVAGAMPESAAAYLQYCMENCAWNDFRFAHVPPGQIRRSLDDLLKSTAWKQPLTDEERKFLAGQIEE